ADPLVEGRAEDPARHLARRLALVADLVVRAGEGAVLETEPDQPAADALLLLPLEGGTTEEISLVELDDPAEPGFEGRVVPVEVVAVEDVPHLEAERVAGAEPRGDEAVVLPRLEELRPERDGVLAADVELEAVLARVPGAADDGGPAVDRALDEVV